MPGAGARRPSALPPLPRRRRQMSARLIGVLAAIGTLAVVIGTATAVVVLQYRTANHASSASSPFVFVPGGNAAIDHTEGLVTVSIPGPTSVTATVQQTGPKGAMGGYALDVLELQARVTSLNGWHFRVSVQTALAGTGINAAFVSYCTQAPTTVPATGAALASGVDANGNPWSIFAPTCAGASASVSVTSVGVGAPIAVASTTTGTSVLYISFAVAVTNTGATTTTAAALTLLATSP